MSEPITSAQWQEAVDGAQGALTFDAACKYGLVIGGPTVNVQRCIYILREGKARGIEPSSDAIERFVTGLMAEQVGDE
jgi:hypothetical protein